MKLVFTSEENLPQQKKSKAEDRGNKSVFMQWFKSKIHYSVIYFHRSINRLIVWWLLVNRVLYLPCRLLQKYKISEDSFQPGKVIFDDYVNNCPEKENYLLQEI